MKKFKWLNKENVLGFVKLYGLFVCVLLFSVLAGAIPAKEFIPALIYLPLFVIITISVISFYMNAASSLDDYFRKFIPDKSKFIRLLRHLLIAIILSIPILSLFIYVLFRSL